MSGEATNLLLLKKLNFINMKLRITTILFITIAFFACKGKDSDNLVTGGNFIGSWVLQEHKWETIDSTGNKIFDSTIVDPYYESAELTFDADSGYIFKLKSWTSASRQQYYMYSGKIFLDNPYIHGLFTPQASSSRLVLTYTDETWPGSGYYRNDIWKFNKK
jgi:hypothetical protein